MTNFLRHKEFPTTEEVTSTQELGIERDVQRLDGTAGIHAPILRLAGGKKVAHIIGQEKIQLVNVYTGFRPERVRGKAPGQKVEELLKIAV